MVTETTMLELLGYDHEVSRLSGSIARLCKRTKADDIRNIANDVGTLMTKYGYGEEKPAAVKKEKVKK